MNDRRWTDLAAAYALGALEGAEQEAFEARMAEDDELRRLVEEYREVATGALASSVSHRAPPAGLKDRVLARARAQRPPSTPSDSSAGGARAAPGTDGTPPSGRGRWVPWLLLAASLAGLAWVGIRNVDLRRDVETLSEQLTQVRASLSGAEAELAVVDSLAEVLAGSDVRFATLTGEAAPTLRLIWNAERRVLLVAASDLPAPPAGRTYQLWGIRGDEAPVSLGTFDTGSSGRALVALSPGVDRGFDVSAVTEEPAGGSPQPTTQPFLVGSWRAAQD